MSLIRKWLIVLFCGLAMAGPARSQEVTENEALVMRLIFEDCLGYVRHDRQPFEGLPTGPASPEVLVAILRGHISGLVGGVELLSPRYVAVWGEDRHRRYCRVETVNSALGTRPPDPPGLLGVAPEGFLDRVTERAAAEGLTEFDHDGEFSPFTVPYWSEAATGHDTGPLRPVSMSAMPMAEDSVTGVLDAGLINVVGPPLPRPSSRRRIAGPGERSFPRRRRM